MTSSAILPVLTDGRFDDISLKSLYVASYGFEERSLGWTNSLIDSKSRVSDSLIFNYVHPRGRNRVADMRRNLKKIGEVSMHEISYDLLSPQGTEDSISESLRLFEDKDEIIIDISSMTKLLILVTLCKLQNFPRQVRIVYSEAEDYAPSRATYERAKKAMKQIANMPSRGFYNLVRAECLSSTRMQGQPITMFAFTSFNEQLVRHVLGSISPHRLILINGRPPRVDYEWREQATLEIHKKLIDEFRIDNPVSYSGRLERTSSTLEYSETYNLLENLYSQFSNLERIMGFATGSKMQTVGLFMFRASHPDVHIEYPSPASYFVKGLSKGVRKIHQIVIPNFSSFLEGLRVRGQESAG